MIRSSTSRGTEEGMKEEERGREVSMLKVVKLSSSVTDLPSSPLFFLLFPPRKQNKGYGKLITCKDALLRLNESGGSSRRGRSVEGRKGGEIHRRVRADLRKVILHS